jgi:phosphoglycolate phosphatase
MLIIFDLDGTLIDSARCVVTCTRDAFIQHQIKPPTGEQVIASMGIPIEKSFVVWSGSSEVEQLIADFRVLYKSRSRELIEVFPGIKEALEKLQEKGHRMAIATSKKREMAELNLCDCGLLSYFFRIIGANDVGNYKPHPESVLKILAETGDDPAQTWVVGDSTFDLQMGRDAGCRTCAVTWGAHHAVDLLSAKPDAIASSASEMLMILE